VFLWHACTETIGEFARRSRRVIHPLLYELETARHMDNLCQASQRRVVAEAETLMSREMRSVPFLRSVICCFDWRVIQAALVRGGTV
jgi:hypothetical protein